MNATYNGDLATYNGNQATYSGIDWLTSLVGVESKSQVGTPQLDIGPADPSLIEPGVITLDGFGTGLLHIRSGLRSWPQAPDNRR